MSNDTLIPFMTLYGVRISPFVRKAMMVLQEKDLSYSLIETLPALYLKAMGQPVPQDLMDVSPLGRVPALKNGTDHIADSAVIAAYLEKRFPNTTRLYPDDPTLYAKALWFENFADHVLSKIIYDKVLTPVVAKPLLFKTECNHDEVKNVIKVELTPLLELLENSLQENQWIAGNIFTIGDIAIASQFSAMDLAGYPVNETQWPKLDSYLKRIKNRKSYQQAVGMAKP